MLDARLSRSPIPAAAPRVAEEGSIDPSLYYESLDDWPLLRSFRVRVSNRLARKVPLHLRHMRNQSPMVSFTFDDATETALTVGARMLEEAGGRATFYLSTALLGRRNELWRWVGPDDVKELHRRGHEIGIHGHAHIPVGALSAAEFLQEMVCARTTLRTIDETIQARNFAYPYGHATFERKEQLSRLVRSSRGIESGVNHGLVDIQLLRSVDLSDNLTEAELDRRLDETVASNGWLVFFSHDVGDRHSPYGVSTRLLSHAIDGAVRRSVRLATVNDALDAAAI